MELKLGYQFGSCRCPHIKNYPWLVVTRVLMGGPYQYSVSLDLSLVGKGMIFFIQVWQGLYQVEPEWVTHRMRWDNVLRAFKHQRVQAGSFMTHSFLWTTNEPPDIKKHVIYNCLEAGYLPFSDMPEKHCEMTAPHSHTGGSPSVHQCISLPMLGGTCDRIRI